MSGLILVDWGTSSFRAILLDEDLKQIDLISTSKGILSIKNKQFHSYLLSQINPWLKNNKDIDILISGMIGSKNGWIETPYCICDVTIKDLTQKIKKVKNIQENIYLLPGVKTTKNNLIDLMRGEEIQVFGSLESLKKDNALVVLPGTHSKWVKVENKTIIDFKTNMTGEVFKAISENTILSSSISNKNIDIESFKKALSFSKKETNLLNTIFQIRANENHIGTNNTYSFLSALLISYEIKSMIDIYKCNEIILVANDTLNELYELAFNSYNIKTIKIESNLTVLEAMKLIYKNLKEV